MMKVASAISVAFVVLFATVWAGRHYPKVPTSVPANASQMAFKIIRWMGQSAMGEEAWPLTFLLDDRCDKCALRTRKSPKQWPEHCTECTDSFWEKLKAVPGCEYCRDSNRQCIRCQKGVNKLYAEQFKLLKEWVEPYSNSLSFTS